MSQANQGAVNKTYLVESTTLPACCPPKDQETWNQHPRVYLEFNQEGKASCPYCGNQFQLNP